MCVCSCCSCHDAIEVSGTQAERAVGNVITANLVHETLLVARQRRVDVQRACAQRMVEAIQICFHGIDGVNN